MEEYFNYSNKINWIWLQQVWQDNENFFNKTLLNIKESESLMRRSALATVQ